MKKELRSETTDTGMQITHGSGNVFADLGFDEEEAANLQVRAVLMQRLQAFVREAGLTQEQAAEVFGVHQPRVSDLMRGKIDAFTVDALVNLLARAGLHLAISFERQAV